MPAAAFVTPMPRGIPPSTSPSSSPLQPRRFRLTSVRLARRTRPPAPSATSAPAARTQRFADLFPPGSSDAVVTPSGASVSLIAHVAAQTAAGRAVLVGWLRHFGCTLCKKQAADWLAMSSRLPACGDVALILVGNGTRQNAQAFVDEMKWPADMFTDPARNTYRALQFRAGVASTFNLPAVRKVVKSFKEGNPQTWSRLPADAFQQGGAVLVDRNGFVQLFHMDAFAGDHFDVDQLYEQTCRACAVPTTA